MNAPRTKYCPSPAELQAYLHPLSKPQAAWDHLAHCPHCQTELERLAAEAGCWDEAQQWLQGDTDDDLVLSRLTTTICALSQDRGASEPHDPLHDFEIEQLQQLIAPASHPELLGRISRYELEQLVGRGGMGLVFRARDSELLRVVAVKTLALHLIPLGAARERFIREARASAALVHPHIVPVHDVITDGPIPALVMQFVAGPTLAGWLATRGPLPWQDVLQLAMQLADALAAAHAHGLVHRDVKPGNVLLEADGSRALLTDFGLVRALDDATLTRSGLLAGTPDYMSPEQARGEPVGTSSDLFSLGSLLYAMLSGHPPFRAGDPMAVLNRICHSRHRSLAVDHPHIPIELSRLVDRLLCKEPRGRPASASELRDRLQQLSQSPLRLKSQTDRRRRWLAAMGLVACLLLLFSGRQWWPARPPAATPTVVNRPDNQIVNRAAAADTASSPAMLESFADLRALDGRIDQVEQQVGRLIRSYPTVPLEQLIPAGVPPNRLDAQLQRLDRDVLRLRREFETP